jgi:hypothetical protein
MFDYDYWYEYWKETVPAVFQDIEKLKASASASFIQKQSFGSLLAKSAQALQSPKLP